MNRLAAIHRGIACLTVAMLAAALPQPALADPARAQATTTIEDPVGAVVLNEPLQLLTTSFNLLVIGPSASGTSLTTLSSSEDTGKKKEQVLAENDLPQQSVSGFYSQNDSDGLRNPVAYRRFGGIYFRSLSVILLQFN